MLAQYVTGVGGKLRVMIKLKLGRPYTVSYLNLFDRFLTQSATSAGATGGS